MINILKQLLQVLSAEKTGLMSLVYKVQFSNARSHENDQNGWLPIYVNSIHNFHPIVDYNYL